MILLFNRRLYGGCSERFPVDISPLNFARFLTRRILDKPNDQQRDGRKRRNRKRPSGGRFDFAILEPRKMLAGFSSGGISGPEAIGLPPDMLAKGYVFVGDHSSSNSETWNLSIGVHGSGKSHVHEADQAGVVIRDKRNFKTGETYAARLTHTGSTYDLGSEDYDYRAWVDRDPGPAWTSGDTPRSDAEFFITDTANVLQKRFFGDNENPISTSTPDALIHFPAIDLDIDSLDDSGFAVPNDNPAEDYTEYDNHFGKTVDLNPDSDVFDALATSFVPVRLALSSNVIGLISSLSLVFNYNIADTSGSSDGLMRLWTKDADQPRTPETAPYYGTDLIPSNVPIDPHNFHLSNGQSLYSALTGGEGATLYLEGVNETNRYSLYDSIDVSAIVSVSTGGTNWSGTLSDTVHVRTEVTEIVIKSIDPDTGSKDDDYITKGESGSITIVGKGPANEELTLFRQEAGEEPIDIDSVTVGADGNWQIADATIETAAYTYFAKVGENKSKDVQVFIDIVKPTTSGYTTIETTGQGQNQDHVLTARLCFHDNLEFTEGAEFTYKINLYSGEELKQEGTDVEASTGPGRAFSVEVDPIEFDSSLIADLASIRIEVVVKNLTDSAGNTHGEDGLKFLISNNVALGLERIEGVNSLQPFASKFGASTSHCWEQLGLETAPNDRFDLAFQQTLDAIIQNNGRVKFNLDSLDVAAALAGDPNDRVGRFTEWELQRIVRNQNWLDSTDFYLDCEKQTEEQLVAMGIIFDDDGQ